MAAGFISFPILTRILSINDYGVLGLLSTIAILVTCVAKLGSQNSILRFYNDYKIRNDLDRFCSTIYFGYGFTALLITMSISIAATFIPESLFQKDIRQLLPLVAVFIFLSCLNFIITSVLRAAQNTKIYNIINVLNRYCSLSLGILFILYAIKGLYGFYFGQILSGIFISIILFVIIHQTQRIRLRNFSFNIFKKSIKFGFFLTWTELGHLFLSYADRFLIQLYLGSTPLGFYTAGYNLATYIIELIMYPINYAYAPIYFRIYSTDGEEETKKFLTKTLSLFFLIVLPIVFGFIAVGRDLIVVLASNKYYEAYKIMPYVVIANSIYACQVIMNVGLFLNKKTFVLMNIKILACVLNICLNIYLIPRYGIIGAAQATLITYVLYTATVIYYSFREFSFPVDFRRFLLYSSSSLLMFFAVKAIGAGNSILNLIIQVVAGAAVYITTVMLFDTKIRHSLSTSMTTIRNRFS